MSIEDKKEVRKSQKSDGRRTESTVAEPDTGDYQNSDFAEHYVTTPGFGGDMNRDLLQVGASCSNEVLNTDPTLRIK
ncbi:hypothetical protein F66182_16257 [Fusarium sp. NRRL 66182]|nr:hypothetical protein F66182_16257 [Fusarium sp. NRRL 66182]